MKEINIKYKLKDIKDLSKEITRSDLQGVITAEVNNIKNNRQKQEKIENVFLLFCDDKININKANKLILELINR